MANDPFNDPFFTQNTKNIKRAGGTAAGCFGAYFLLTLIASLALTGVIIWAIIVLVQHFAS